MLKSTLHHAILFCTLTAALLSGCGDSTGPGIPNVAGTYRVTGSIEAAPCTPRQLPSGGYVILEAFKFEDFGTFTLEITQEGSQLTVRDLEFPGALPYTGTVDQNGNVRFAQVFVFTESPRQGNRVFRVTLTEDWTLQREDGGNRLRGTASFVNVFREGQNTEVFTTCSRGATPTLTRIGG
jgi:hypothetical protein